MSPAKILKDLCDVCGEGHLTVRKLTRPFEYGAVKGAVCMHLSQCESCGAEVATPEQMKQNRREVIRFKKMVDRIPSGAEICAFRKGVGLRQEDAGIVLGGGPVAFSKYENDDLIPDASMANLLRGAMAMPELVTFLANFHGVELVQAYHVTADFVLEDSTAEAASASGHILSSGYVGPERRRAGRSSHQATGLYGATNEYGGGDSWNQH